jgi:hypothetical protein
MNALVREDGWGKPIGYETGANSTFKLISRGPDDQRGTADDVVVENSGSVAP